MTRWVFVVFSFQVLFSGTLASFLYGQACSERNTAYLYPNQFIYPTNHTIYCLALGEAIKASSIKLVTQDILNSVDTLYADQLYLNKVPKLVIRALPNLTLIDLTLNRIKHIPFLLNNFAPKIETLLMDNNKLLIPKRRPLFVSKSLKTLSVASNGISNIYPVTFSKLPSLKVLYLNENELKVINPKVFQPVPGLLYLNLEGNCIRKFPTKEKMPVFLRVYLTKRQCKSEIEQLEKDETVNIHPIK